MSVIYEPKGKAKEYCELAVNLYHGCDHGCLYCYAPAATYKMREDFIKPRHRPGIIEQIKKDSRQAGMTGKEVLLCFTCDPYSKFASQYDITRQAIQTLHEGGMNITILTKGGIRSTKDFDILDKGDKYGATLTFVSDADSKKWEPGAALPHGRLVGLRHAHTLGITTWASLEPVIDPEQSLEIIDRTIDFVDIYKVGKWNHDKRADGIDWKAFGEAAIAKLSKYHAKFYIKNDLKKYLIKTLKNP